MAGGRRLHSISNKLLAVLVTVAVLPTVTVSIYALRKGSEALSDRELSLLLDTVSGEARLLQTKLDSALDDLRDVDPARIEELCRALMLENASLGDRAVQLDQVEDRLLHYARSHPAVEEVLLIGLHLPASATGSPARPRPWRLLRIEQTEGHTLPRRPLDPKGRWLDPAPGDPFDELETELLAVFEKEFESHRNRPIHQVTVPTPGGDVREGTMIRIGAQRPYGQLLLAVSWSRLIETTCRNVIENLGGVSGGVDASLYDASLQELASTGEVVPVPEDLRAAAQAGRSGGIVTHRGDMLLFSPVSGRARAQQDFLVLAVRRPATRDEVSRFRIVFSLVLAGALLLALILGTYLSRRMTRPLRSLREQARRVGAGELDAAITVRTEDEVQEVADAFVSMTTQLRTLYQGMEQTIEARTQQLRQALDELRTTHDAMAESEARYSDLVENASDLIQVTDTQGRFESVNRRQAELFGQDVNALKGQDFFQWVAEDQREATRSAFDQVLRGSSLSAYPSALCVPEDSRLPVEISATPVVRAGICEGVRAFLRDVSERRRMEAQLIKAERLSSVGALAAGVAHEINNPLGIIHLFAQRTLEKGKRGEVDLDKLQKIVDQTQRVAKITKGLLDFSRSGPTESRPFSVGKVLEETVALLVERAERSNIRLTSHVDPSLPPVRGNATQIGQVLLNLLLNALQAIGNDGHVDVVAEEVVEGEGRWVRVRVEDSGPGISDEMLPHLFEPFFTTKEPGEGTGLGLSVSYGILKEHHGTLRAENRAEGGARFVFELPVSPG